MTPLRIATLAREMSAKVTGRDSRVLVGFLVLWDSPAVHVTVVDSLSTAAENGRGVEMGYLKFVAMRALMLAARLEDFAARRCKDGKAVREGNEERITLRIIFGRE